MYSAYFWHYRAFIIFRYDFHQCSDAYLIEIVQTCVIFHNILVKLRLLGFLDDKEDWNNLFLHPMAKLEELSDPSALIHNDNGEEVELNPLREAKILSWFE